MKRGSEMTAQKAIAQKARESRFCQSPGDSDRRVRGTGGARARSRHDDGDAAKPAVVPFTIIGSLAMIVLLVVFSPFRDGIAGHVIAAIAGLLSVVCATTVTLGRVIFAADVAGGKDFSMEDSWIAGVGGLLIVLIVDILRTADGPRKPHAPHPLAVAQRGRRRCHDRQRGLVLPAGAPADNAFQAAAMSAASGATVDMFSNVTTTWVVAAIVMVLVAVALTVCSYFWHRDADPEPDARSPWIGLALLPVMLAGLAVGLAALAIVVL